jgi:hypothetical protein
MLLLIRMEELLYCEAAVELLIGRFIFVIAALTERRDPGLIKLSAEPPPPIRL